MPKNFNDVMASKSNGRRRATETVCFSPDLAEEYQAHLIAAAAAKSDDDRRSRDPEASENRRSADVPKWQAELQKAAALVEDNPDAFFDVELEQMRRADWLRLRTAHMPRDSHKEDEGRYNTATFPPAALAASMVEPEPADDVIAYFEDTLSSGEWRRLATVIWNLNEGARSIPKADQLSSILDAFAQN